MSKAVKKANFWVRRRSHIPLIVIGGLMVVMLFFNDETSFSQSMEYDRTIASLKADIASCHDSAAYYRRQREAIVHGTEDVERLAREKFHMQKPSEDVYILR